MPPRLYEYGGERLTLKQWAQRTGLTYACVQSRFRQGTAIDKPKANCGRPLGYRPPAKP